MNNEYLIGVDGGGTKTKLLLTDTNANQLAVAITGPSNITRSIDIALKSIKHGIELLSKQSKIELKNSQIRICLGLAGAENEQIKNAIFIQSPSIHSIL